MFEVITYTSTGATPVVDLSHPLEKISERGLLPKHPFPGPVDLPLVSGAFLWAWRGVA